MAQDVSENGNGRGGPERAGSSSSTQRDNGDSRQSALGRRALLTRGGVVAAGVVGAGALGAAAAAPASAQGGDLVLNQANDAGANLTVTELDADNSTTPALIVTNTGTDVETSGTFTGTFSAPNLRLTPSPTTANAFFPVLTSVGGDVTATPDGNLYFTHDFSLQGGTVGAAVVHTDATDNVFAGLEAPVRILDTRSAPGRANIINPSGNLNSAGQIITGKTIYINLDSLVFFSDAVFANVTATQTTTSGFLTVWAGFISGASNPTAPPAASNINWQTANVTIANFTAAGTGVYPPGQFSTPTDQNVVAIFADTTTHVIMDVIGFALPGFQYLVANSGSTRTGAGNARLTRLAHAQARMRNSAKS